MGIRYNSPDSVLACRDKFLARERFRSAGLPVPEYFRAPIGDGPERAADRASYPCVLKPLGLSASRGVIRANDRAEFVAAFRRIAELLAEPDIARLQEEQNRFIQVENFIEGREFALEGILLDGRLRVLALFDKPDPLDGPYFEETIYITPSREERGAQRDAIVRTTEARDSGAGPHARAGARRDAGKPARRLDVGGGRQAHRRFVRAGASGSGRADPASRRWRRCCVVSDAERCRDGHDDSRSHAKGFM